MNKGYHFWAQENLLSALGKKVLFFIMLLILIWEISIFYNKF